jgi:hypothetical protein
MGGTAAPAAMRDLETGEIVKVDGGLKREANDFYPTPAEPIRAFLKAEFEFIRKHQCVIWEPCAGDGAMARELEAAGLSVIKTDIIDRGCGAVIRDFYDFAPPLPWHAIITNPPFADCNGASPFLRHALDVLKADYLALLLPAGWWGAAERAALWNDHTPSIVYSMRWRIDFTGQGAPPMLNAWYVWDKNRPVANGETRLAMLDRNMDARQGDLL